MKRLILKSLEKDTISINEEDIATDFIRIMNEEVTCKFNTSLFVSEEGQFKGKAIVLDGRFDYVVGKDEDDLPILVALK